jgi:hypothetical protein
MDVKMYNADAKQDQFVAEILNFKKDGTYLDIGSNDSIKSNNTYFLADSLDWKGICIEMDGSFSSTYKRKNNLFLSQNAAMVDYNGIFLDFFGDVRSIDYLSLDVDTASLSVLKNLPLSNFRFRVITIEHDYYLYGETYRAEQRNILGSNGYLLLCSDVYAEQEGYYGKQCSFEDWWIDPNEFSVDIIDKVKSSFEYPSSIISKIKSPGLL